MTHHAVPGKRCSPQNAQGSGGRAVPPLKDQYKSQPRACLPHILLLNPSALGTQLHHTHGLQHPLRIHLRTHPAGQQLQRALCPAVPGFPCHHQPFPCAGHPARTHHDLLPPEHRRRIHLL
ncbi:hypothetical protein RLOC_00011272, partial [Lonchura striata]